MKGTWALADALYWFFYIPLTAIIIIALVTIPTNVMKATIQPVELDASIMEERLAMKIKYSGLESTRLTMSEKKHGYKVTIGKESVFGNKDFYEEAIPLTPIKHKRFTYKDNKATIDQVYTEQYG